jgi:hypothetical protein
VNVGGVETTAANIVDATITSLVVMAIMTAKIVAETIRTTTANIVDMDVAYIKVVAVAANVIPTHIIDGVAGNVTTLDVTAKDAMSRTTQPHLFQRWVSEMCASVKIWGDTFTWYNTLVRALFGLCLPAITIHLYGQGRQLVFLCFFLLAMHR